MYQIANNRRKKKLVHASLGMLIQVSLHLFSPMFFECTNAFIMVHGYLHHVMEVTRDCTLHFNIFDFLGCHRTFRSMWSKWSYACIHNEAKISALVGCANIINTRKIEITNERSLRLGNVLMGNEIIPCCGLFGIHMLPPNHFNEPS